MTGQEENICHDNAKTKREAFVLNCDLIETIMENPDTTTTLTNGKHLIVRESRRSKRRQWSSAGGIPRDD